MGGNIFTFDMSSLNSELRPEACCLNNSDCQELRYWRMRNYILKKEKNNSEIQKYCIKNQRRHRRASRKSMRAELAAECLWGAKRDPEAKAGPSFPFLSLSLGSDLGAHSTDHTETTGRVTPLCLEHPCSLNPNITGSTVCFCREGNWECLKGRAWMSGNIFCEEKE